MIYLPMKFSLTSLFLLGLFFLSSCIPVYYKVPKGDVFSANSTNYFWGGVATEDITPIAGGSMAGLGSDIGKVSRGHWGRVTVNSHYIEDKKGNYLVIITSDLWSIPKGLTDKVMALLHKSENLEINIARENILFTATHTHHSIGNYSSSLGYNLGSSTVRGFDKSSFNNLAQSFAKSIEQAVLSKEKIDLTYSRKEVYGLSRNRSIDAFLNNRPEDLAKFIGRSNTASSFASDTPRCLADREEQFEAIDPTLTIITALSRRTQVPIFCLANFALHPTVMGSNSELVSADVYGVAAKTVENYLSSNQREETVVSFFNGAEGDISGNWAEQGRSETLRIGQAIAGHIIELLNVDNQESITSDIIPRLSFVNINNQSVADMRDELYCDNRFNQVTAKSPFLGKSVLKGAEDGRIEKKGPINECFFEEAITDQVCSRGHGKKDKFIPEISNLFLKPSAPKILPIGMYSIGELIIVSIPGEASVALGQRFKDVATESPTNQAIIAGLANEYVSYFTTPAEYELQYYEGASTLYGPATGIFIEEHISWVKRYYRPFNNYYGLKKYTPASALVPFKSKKLEREFKKRLFNRYRLMSGIGDKYLIEGKDYIHYDWDIDFIDNSEVPSVLVEEIIDGQPTPLKLQCSLLDFGYDYEEIQSDSDSYNVMPYVRGDGLGNTEWSTIWFYDLHKLLDKTIRFKIDVNGRSFYSADFKIE